MPETTIRISPEVYNALSAFSDEFNGQLAAGDLRPDGWYELPVPEEVIALLDRIDEDPDQAARALLGWAPLPS